MNRSRVKVVIDLQSTYPLHAQIKERLKLALAFGELRPGDTLLSIREMARELNVGAGVVRRAYAELAQAGILSISRSRRVVVNRELMYRRNGQVLRQTQQLAARVVGEVFAMGIHPQSFAQFLQHWLQETRRCENMIIFAECNCVQAEQYAEEAARAWGVPVQGMTFDALRQLSPARLRRTRYLVTIPYHYEEACQIAQKAHKEVVTVSVDWDAGVLEQIKRLGAGGKVVFVFEQRDCDSYGRLIVKEVEEKFSGSGITFSCVAINRLVDIRQWVRGKEWDLIFFSNRLWESLPPEVRSRPNVAMPKLKMDPLSLERARIEVGVLS